jgi:hypothetical protein
MYKILCLALLFALSSPAFAAEEIPSTKIGSGEYHKLIFHVYDATLYSDDGKFSWEKPFALRLDYKKEIEGADIAERSIKEMNQIEKLPQDKASKWLGEMKAIFPNVKNGDSITGVSIPGKGAAFYKNGAKLGEINNADFSRRFFGIWLDEKTSDAKLRAELLGTKP